VVQSSFNDSGAVYKYSQAPLAGGLEKGIGSFNPFEKGKPQATSEKAKGQGRLTAEWIDYETRSPGRPAQKIRRQVFDLLGPAARTEKNVPRPKLEEADRLERGLGLMGETEILALGCKLPPDYVTHYAATAMLKNRQVLSRMFQEDVRVQAKNFTDRLKTLTPLPSPLYSLALARLGWGRHSCDVYLNCPNVLSHHKFLRLNKDQVVLCQGFDIVSNEIAVFPGKHLSPFLVRLEQGVLDTNAEAVLVGSCGRVENIGQILAQATETGSEWVALRNLQDPGWQRVQVPKDSRTRIEKDLAAGYVVIVPNKASQGALGWWRVDPSTGLTLGLGQEGWGQATAEYAFWGSLIVTSVAFLYCGMQATNGVTLTFCVISNMSTTVMWFGALVGGSLIGTVVLVLLTVGLLAIIPAWMNTPYDGH
jgi:hypothetical protein